MYSYDYSYNYDQTSLASIFAIIAAYWIFLIIIYVVVAIPKMKLFEKAGKPGWAAFVPVYMDYVLFEITWGNGILFLLMLIPFANVVIGIMTLIKLAQAFGKGGGWACGLIFLNIIFLYIMAFSKDIVYVGVPGKTADYGYGQQGYQQQPNYQNPYSQGYQNPYDQQNNYQQTGYQAPPQQTQQQSNQNPNYYYQQPTAQSGSKYCAGCGAQLTNNEKFCPKCGKQQ